MSDQAKHKIEAARRSFNSELLAADYAGIHGDEAQIGRMVELLEPRPGGSYLDLATGIGHVAFAIAARHPEARVLGIDIADQAIARNSAVARAQGQANVEFRLTDGQTLDFPDGAFDGIASRYALHHFPDPAATLAHARRVLGPGGTLVLADAVRRAGDETDFINRFQALKPDGHVRMHGAEALVALVRAQGFQATDRFGSALSFTRRLDDDHRRLIDQTPREILDLYGVTIDGDQAALTFEILTVRFLAAGG